MTGCGSFFYGALQGAHDGGFGKKMGKIGPPLYKNGENRTPRYNQ